MKVLIFDLDDTLYDTSDRLDTIVPNFGTMRLFPDALKILQGSSIDKILVTHGKKEIQELKIKTLALTPYFKEIYIHEDREEKLDSFKKILKKYNIIDPKKVFVVGDRIDTEIRYGNMLGATTVHIRSGKYKELLPKDALEIPTHTISSLFELRSLLR